MENLETQSATVLEMVRAVNSDEQITDYVRSLLDRDDVSFQVLPDNSPLENLRNLGICVMALDPRILSSLALGTAAVRIHEVFGRQVPRDRLAYIRKHIEQTMSTKDLALSTDEFKIMVASMMIVCEFYYHIANIEEGA